MREFTTDITEEKENNPYWNIYEYHFMDLETGKYGFKVGKCENGYYKRYNHADTNGKHPILLAHEDSLKGDIDQPIVNHFKNDARFERKEDSDETFFPKDNPFEKSSLNIAVEEFKKFFTEQNFKKYFQSKEEIDTKNEILKLNANVIIMHFCPRYHKTGMILNLIQDQQRKLNIIMSYEHTIHSSYENDNKYYGFNKEIKVINADDLMDSSELLQYMKDYKKVAIVLFMTGSIDSLLKRLSKLQKTDVNIYIDEADVAIQTKLSKEKIKQLKKVVKIKKLFIASGTGLHKMIEVVKNFNYNKYEKLTRAYIQDVLIPRGNKAVEINFIKYRNIGKFLEVFGENFTYENWNDETLKNNRGNLEMLFKFFFDANNFFTELKATARAQNLFNLINNISNLETFRKNHFNEEAATILYVGNKNETHSYIKSILDSLNIPCFIIDSSTTSNADAENAVKGQLKQYPKTAFIATNMANRSFSIPQIKNEIILMNNPSDDSYTQKCYRIATYSDEFSDFNKGFIWDLTLDKKDDNLYSIIGPEIERGFEKGYTIDQTLEEIFKDNRVHFYFGAINNKNIFEEVDASKLSKQLLLTTNVFDDKLDQIIKQVDHNFNMNIIINDSNIKNTIKGQGDRKEKTIKKTLKEPSNNNTAIQEKTAIDNKRIFISITKMILGSKTFFYNCDIDNLVPEFWKMFGYDITDIEFVLNTLIENFGEELIKSKMDDSFYISTKNLPKEEYNLRNFDYNIFPEWTSKVDSLNIESEDSVIITIGLKSKLYIENIAKRNKNIYIIEFFEFTKDLSNQFKNRYFLGKKTKEWVEKDFIEILETIKSTMNEKSRLIFLGNPPFYFPKPDGFKRASSHLDSLIYKKILNEAPKSDIIFLMSHTCDQMKNMHYTSIEECDNKKFPEISIGISLFTHLQNAKEIEIINKYEKNGKYKWLEENKLLNGISLHDILIDQYSLKKKNIFNEPLIPEGYIAFNERASKFKVFLEGELGIKSNGGHYKCLMFIKTNKQQEFKEWLEGKINIIYKQFVSQFVDIHIDRGFAKCIEVPEELL